MQSKLARDIIVGDKIIMDKTGEVVMVTISEKGWYADGCRLLVWLGGWSCVPNKDRIAIAD